MLDTTMPTDEQLPTVSSLRHDLVLVVAAGTRARLRQAKALLGAAARARREAWTCAALVAVILAASLSCAWLVWDTTVQHRQAAAAKPATGAAQAGSLEDSLVDSDVLRDLEVQRGDAPGQGRGDAPRESANGTGAPSKGGLSKVGGWLLSLAAVSSVLAAGMGAAVAVVRRHRRRVGEPAAAQGVLVEGWLPDVADAEPSAHVDEQAPEPSGSDDVTDVDDAPAEQLVDQLQHAAARASSSTAPLSTTSSRVVVGEPVGPRIEAHQRLYERRSAPRVEYVLPARVDARGVRWEVSVRDLSGTGLRLRVPPEQDGRLPAAKDYVQVDFPVDGGRVHVAAQVAWRRTTSDGIEMGLVFRPLAERDAELISATCLARL